MSLDLAADLWNEFQRFINKMDKDDAADTLVNLLIDNDYDIEDIQQAFKGDTVIKQALQSYLADNNDTEEDDDDEDHDDDY